MTILFDSISRSVGSYCIKWTPDVSCKVLRWHANVTSYRVSVATPLLWIHFDWIECWWCKKLFFLWFQLKITLMLKCFKPFSYNYVSISQDYFQFTLSQNVDRTISMGRFEEDHQMFYCPQDGYWHNTLIRIRNAKGVENVGLSVAYEMKVYNRYGCHIYF